MEQISHTFAGGAWSPTRGAHASALIDPSTEDCLATVRESSPADIEDAVAAAVSAAPAMRSLTPDDRAGLLRRVADQLESRADRLGTAITGSMGMPVKLCQDYQVQPSIWTLRGLADLAAGLEFTERIGHSLVRHDPVGVVAAVTPWNYPLLQTVSKLGAAWAAGCPVVLKPSELTPLDALILAEAVEAAGLPAGALNLVLGTGPQAGEQLVRHPGVRMVTLTGSTRAGRRVAQLAGVEVKRVTLELGGKSAAVVLSGADLEAAVHHTVDTVMVNSGQTCTALTRLLVPAALLGDVERLVTGAMSGYRVGPAHDPAVDVGPLANAAQRRIVDEHRDRALIEGARMIWQYDAEALPDTGFFTPPCAFAVSDPSLAVAQEEIFGPVLSVIGYDSADEAVAIANGTPYGLAGSVWAAEEDEALAIADRMEAGSIDLNGAPFNPEAPFGGVKQSGYGRELGASGILDFTQTKAIQTKAIQRPVRSEHA